MVGERTGKTYKLGETVRVRVIGTDYLERTIDFEFVE
jgi:ribonuclease R